MLRRLSVALAFSLLTILEGGCAATRNHIAAGAPPPRIVDHDLLALYEDAAAEVIERNKVTLEILEEQLERPQPLPPGAWSTPASTPLSLQDLYAQRSPGVLMVIRIYKCPRCSNWHADTEATGFLVRADGIAVTCRHVIAMDTAQKLDDVIIFGDARGRIYPVTGVIASSLADDLAVVKLDMSILDSLDESEHPQPIPIRRDAAIGEPVSVIAHPDHNHYLLTHGIVSRVGSSYGGVSGDHKLLATVATPTMNITAEIGAGSSGAPVLDEAGNAVGVVVSTLAISHGEASSKTQMVVRICSPSAQLMKLIDRTAPSSKPAR